jgi:hypothetical protein
MTALPGRRFGWAVLSVVLGALLLGAVGHLAAGSNDLRREGAGLPDRDAAAPVVVVGVPGLSWSDIDPATTPTLGRWRADGASGVLVVRGAHPVTCAADGWLTLGAGQRAAADVPGSGAGSTCGPQQVGLTPVGDAPADASGAGPGDGVRVEGWSRWVDQAAARPLDARLGTLGDSLAGEDRCVAAYGPLAALGAADSEGRVSHYQDTGLSDWSGELAASCAVHLVDGSEGSTDPDSPAVDGVDPEALDAELARVSEQWPTDTVVVVAGLADRGEQAGLRAVIVSGPEEWQGALVSPSTRQPGLVQTADLTATVLAMSGADTAPQVGGQPVDVLSSPADARIRDDADLATAGTVAQSLAAPFLAVTTVLALALIALASRFSGMTAAVVATGAQAVPAAAFLAQLVPWWRVTDAGLEGGDLLVKGLGLGAAVLAGVIVQLALAWGGSWRRHALGPPMVVAGTTVVVIGLDVIWGGRLGLTSVLGVQPVVGGRFYGMGNVGFGIISASLLLLAGFLAATLGGSRAASVAGASRVNVAASANRTHRASVAVVVTLGVVIAAVDGWPTWGADFGGVSPILVATGLLALAASGVRLTTARVLLLGTLAFAAAALVMVLDWLRPAEARSHLGAFVQSALDGDAWPVVTRKLDQSVGILIDYPVSWLAVAALGLVAWGLAVQSSPPGRLLAPLWQVPLLHATGVALVTCLVLGWVLNDSGIAIVAIGLGIAIAALLAVRLRLPAG